MSCSPTILTCVTWSTAHLLRPVGSHTFHHRHLAARGHKALTRSVVTVLWSLAIHHGTTEVICSEKNPHIGRKSEMPVVSTSTGIHTSSALTDPAIRHASWTSAACQGVDHHVYPSDSSRRSCAPLGTCPFVCGRIRHPSRPFSKARILTISPRICRPQSSSGPLIGEEEGVRC